MSKRRAIRPAKQAQVVVIRRPTEAVWRHALELALGDPRRLDVLADGSVVVRNKRVR